MNPEQFWSSVDWVLLDMDGTLLDLQFDNFFWQEHIPKVFATENQIAIEAAHDRLGEFYSEHAGTLNWYCLDFWSEQLALPISTLKRDVSERVAVRPGTIKFLRKMQTLGKQVWLLTNAHPDSIAVKLEQTNLSAYLDQIISSHELGYPKEHIDFWNRLNARSEFNRERSCFIDDSESVLLMARRYGIKHIYAVSQPDSSQAKRAVEGFNEVNYLDELIAPSRNMHEQAT